MNWLRKKLWEWAIALERLHHPGAVDWTPQDEQTLQTFLFCETGQKLDRRMVDESIEACRQATQMSGNMEYAAGYACGHRVAWAQVKALSADLSPKVEAPESEPTESGSGFDTGSSQETES